MSDLHWKKEDRLETLKYYTVDETRSILSVGRTKVYELMKTGAIRYINIGSVRRIPHAELLRFQDLHLRES